MPSIAVIGAGMVGLCSAVQIQENIPDATVTIIADKFSKDTTSDGAGGLVRPTRMFIKGVDEALLKTWIQDSWSHYEQLAKSDIASEAGVTYISGYHFFEEDSLLDPLFKDWVFNFRPATEKEFQMFNVPPNRHGTACTTLLVEGRWHLPWLMRKFRLQGGRVESRTVESLAEFVGKYDLVVNCSGLGSIKLANDKTLYPIRGQMFRAKAPWVKNFVFFDQNCWILPGRETVVVGGTRQYYNGNLELDEADTKAVWERACKLMPSIKAAKWEWQWVGLRPTREPVRVEKEVMHFDGKPIKVVHNYGHGGNGIGIGWGTAKHATRLVKEMLENETATAKL